MIRLFNKDKKTRLILARLIGLTTMIVVSYLYLNGSHYSKLAGYFVYMSLACSIIPLPSPPYVIGMGKIFDPWIVALLGSLGNCIAAFFEYYFLTWLFSRTELQHKIESSKLFQRLAAIFKRAVFLIILLTSFSPIPLDPFYLTAIMIRYSLPKYLLAVLLGKYLRYYLLAQVGESLQIPNLYLIIMLFALLCLPIAVALLLKRTRVPQYTPEKSLV